MPFVVSPRNNSHHNLPGIVAMSELEKCAKYCLQCEEN